MSLNFSPVYLVFLIFLASCGDPAEQQANREKLIEGLDDHKIKKVTEEQILSAAYQHGNRIIDLLDSLYGDSLYRASMSRLQLDSLNGVMNHQGFKLVTLATPLAELSEYELALFEAYQYSAQQGQTLNQNVQSIGDQYLLYTHPMVREKEFLGMWSFLLSRKTLIRNL